MTSDIQTGQTGKTRLTFYFSGGGSNPLITGGVVISVKIFDITIEKPWKTEVWGKGTSTGSQLSQHILKIAESNQDFTSSIIRPQNAPKR